MLNYQRFWLVVVPSLSGVQIFATPRTTECQAPSLSSIVYEFAQTQVHWIVDSPTISFSVIPSSCLQSFRARGSFLIVDSLNQMDTVLALQLQHQSFQWICRVDFLSDWLVWSPCCSNAKSPHESNLRHIHFHWSQKRKKCRREGWKRRESWGREKKIKRRKGREK